MSFWVEQRLLVRRLRVHFLAAPLADVAVLTGDREPLPGAARDHWLVWQSLTGTAVTTRLPTDATGLAYRLRLPAGAQGALVRSMIGGAHGRGVRAPGGVSALRG